MKHGKIYVSHLYDQLDAAEQAYENLMSEGKFENAVVVQKIIADLQKEIAWQEKEGDKR